jgi:putative flippase GtrA
MTTTSSVPGRATRPLSKLLRYSAASVVTTVITLSLLAVLLLGVTPGWANVVAVAVGSVVSFEANRRWVWRQIDRRTRWRQLLAFVCVSLIFLALSGLAVHEVVPSLGPRSGSMTRVFLIETTTVAVFGVRWATQYLLLDRVLFRPGARVSPSTSSSQ